MGLTFSRQRSLLALVLGALLVVPSAAIAQEQKGRRELSAVAGGWDKAVKATKS